MKNIIEHRFYYFHIMLFVFGVFFVSMCQAQLMAADTSGYAVTPLMKLQQDSLVSEIISHVDASTVKSCIQGLQNFVTRRWDQSNRDSVFQYVKNKFINAGVTDVKLDSFTYSSALQQNVVATITGSKNPEKVIIVGGHMDSQNKYGDPTRAPGADDNASGTSAAIEMARVLRLAHYQPSVTLQFIGFAAEEAVPPGLNGSKHFAQEARSAGMDIKVMMNYDMIGYRQRWQSDRDFNIIWYPGSETFRDIQAVMATMYTSLTPYFTTTNYQNSDSYSFYEQSYSTVFCMERDFTPSDPRYHTPNDIIDSLDIPYACDIIKSGLATLLTLDMVPPAIARIQLLNQGNGTTIIARWDSSTVPDFSAYKVQIGTASGVYDSIYLQTEREHVFTNLVSDKPYYISISIVDIVGLESQIVEQTITPLVSVHDLADIPMEFCMEQNYPNPFNPSTTIKFTIPDREKVSLKVFNVLGLEVSTLVNGIMPAGTHSVNWNAGTSPSGVYFYRLQTASNADFKKMILTK
jgi:hypothetical protein